MSIEKIAKFYDKNHLEIRALDQKIFDSLPGIANMMFKKRSDYSAKPKLPYKIPNSLDSGILNGFNDSLEKNFKEFSMNQNEQLKLFGIVYFASNVLKFLHTNDFELKDIDPHFKVLSSHTENLNWHWMANGVVQDFIKAQVTEEFLEERYNIDLSYMMTDLPLFDGEAPYFNHSLGRIIKAVYLSPQNGQKKFNLF